MQKHTFTNMSRVSLIAISVSELEYPLCHIFNGFPCGSDGKESAQVAGDLGPEDSLEKGMATHARILAWRIPETEEPAGYSPWNCKEFDMTKRLTLNVCFKQLEPSVIHNYIV